MFMMEKRPSNSWIVSWGIIRSRSSMKINTKLHSPQHTFMYHIMLFGLKKVRNSL